MTVVWITGLPSSGKTTLAIGLRERLRATGACAVVLDGDELRGVLDDHRYEPAARDAFYGTLGRLAAMIANQGTIAIVAATAPSREHREAARTRALRFVEVYVDTPVAECARRDTKGLYAASRRGDVVDLPGSGVAYEVPTSPDVVAHGGIDDAAIAAIIARLR